MLNVKIPADWSFSDVSNDHFIPDVIEGGIFPETLEIIVKKTVGAALKSTENPKSHLLSF